MAKKTLKPFLVVGTDRNDADEPTVTFVMATDEDDAVEIALAAAGFTEKEIKIITDDYDEDEDVENEDSDEDDDDDYSGSFDALGFKVFPVPTEAKFVRKNTPDVNSGRASSKAEFDDRGMEKQVKKYKLEEQAAAWNRTIMHKPSRYFPEKYRITNGIPNWVPGDSYIMGLYLALNDAGKLLPKWKNK